MKKMTRWEMQGLLLCLQLVLAVLGPWKQWSPLSKVLNLNNGKKMCEQSEASI